MVESLARVEMVIAIKETDLIGEYENHQGRPLIASPSWTGRILLEREIQANLQIARGIREALVIIRSIQHESSMRFQMLDSIASELQGRLGEHPVTPPPSPVNPTPQ